MLKIAFRKKPTFLFKYTKLVSYFRKYINLHLILNNKVSSYRLLAFSTKCTQTLSNQGFPKVTP